MNVARGVVATGYFSIRESVFKCIFPHLRIRMDWHHCRVSVDWKRGTFLACLLSPPHGLEGEFLRGNFRYTATMFTSVCWWVDP